MARTSRIAAGSPDAMVFTDIDGATGEMVLKTAARADANNWGTPVEIARGDAIVAADISRISDGSLLAAWVEIGAADLANPTAPSMIKSARSTDGGATWSAPAEVASLDRVADRLFLESSGALNALIFCTAEGGPSSELRTVSGATFTPVGGWAAARRIGPDAGHRRARCGGLRRLGVVRLRDRRRRAEGIDVERRRPGRDRQRTGRGEGICSVADAWRALCDRLRPGGGRRADASVGRRQSFPDRHPLPR
ncbi:MAG: hypothetical protein R3F11_05940 [Verrucomicrobiales bacterium]